MSPLQSSVMEMAILGDLDALGLNIDHFLSAETKKIRSKSVKLKNTKN